MADSRHSDAREEGMPEREWEQLSPDPDLREDLGYELLDLEVYETEGKHVLFLPKDEDMLRSEAYIVAGKADVHTFGE